MDTESYWNRKKFFKVGRDLCNGNVDKAKETLLERLESNVDEELISVFAYS